MMGLEVGLISIHVPGNMNFADPTVFTLSFIIALVIILVFSRCLSLTSLSYVLTRLYNNYNYQNPFGLKCMVARHSALLSCLT